MNNRLPDKNEWEKIVGDAFSSGDIHVFSDSYERRKESMQKGIVMKRTDERIRTHENTARRSSGAKIAAPLIAAAALVAVVPVSVHLLGGGGNSSPEYAAEISEDTLGSEAETETSPAEGVTEYTFISGGEVVEEGTMVSYETEDDTNGYEVSESYSDFTELTDKLYTVGYDYDNNGMEFYGFGNVVPEGTPGTWPDSYGSDISVTLDSAHYQDNFDGIYTDGIAREADYSRFIGDDGKLISNTRIWYRFSENDDTGIEWQPIQKEMIPKKILVAELTYTNNSGQEVKECVCPRLWVTDEGKLFMLGDNVKKESADWYEDEIDMKCDRWGHFSYSSDKQIDKNEVLLAPGESAKVQVAFLVNEYDIGDIYFELMPGYEGDMRKMIENSPVVDLTKIK